MLRKKRAERLSLQKCKMKSSQEERVFMAIQCVVEQNSRLYKKKKLRGAPQRSKTRSLEDRRDALSQIEEPEFFYSKESLPFSKAGAVRNHEAVGLFGRVITCVTCSLELCENHEPNPDLNPGFQKIIIPGVSSLVTCTVSLAKITDALSESA